MSRFQVVVLSILVVLASAACSAALGAAEAGRVESPTGRTPRMFWTSKRQAVYNRMVAEDHVWWQRLKAWAEATGTPNARYADRGLYATMAYQMTGDRHFARLAWDRAVKTLDTMRPAWNSRNGTRHEFISWVWMYDWLYPALAPEERTKFVDYLNHLGDLVLDKVEGVKWGTRRGDSDEATGHYLGLACLDVATAPENPRAGTFLSASWGPSKREVPVGGLGATGVNRDTLRNTISQFVSLAEGGVWIESAEYNQGTLRLLFVGAEGVRTATGEDHFPEATALLPEAAMYQVYVASSDAKNDGQFYQWGDCERPRVMRIQGYVTLLGVLAGLTQDNSQVGPYLHQLTEELANSPFYEHSEKVYAEFFLFYNPYAPMADWRGRIPKGYYATGAGLMHFHDGWAPADSFFSAHMPNRLGVDHEVRFLGDFQLFRKGEWALTHPITYCGYGGVGHNSMLIAGLSSMDEMRSAVAQEFGPDGQYAYLVGATGGQRFGEGAWSPPPTFLDEWTRSILYLPSPQKTSDTIIVYDRTNARDPQKLEHFEGYPKKIQPLIKDAKAFKQWIIHMPVEPELADDTITWKTPGGQNVRVDTLLPAGSTKTVYDEKEIGVPGYHGKSEEKFQVRIRPETANRWDTFLNVVSVCDGDAAPTATLVKSVGGEAEGVLVVRRQCPDTLVMFGAKQRPDLPTGKSVNGRSVYDPSVPGILKRVRLLKEGYEVTWTAGTDTNVYLMDIDPAVSWTASLDGAPETPVEVSPQGIARMEVEGTGAHTLVIGKP